MAESKANEKKSTLRRLDNLNLLVGLCGSAKGQLISKCLFGVFDFFQKNERMNSFLLLCDVFPFVFFEQIEDTKKAFRN